MSGPRLLTEHAALKARCQILREEIHEVESTGGSIRRIWNLRDALWEAEDRIRAIEKSPAWQRQNGDLDE